ncbi:MAG: hydrogenase 3 maturation endopeptidase HyCI [Armatimonadota bacterium]|nr:hydrogenase 3 maturation endopeptidase HyCI [Armatimonadota bacterium]
MGLAEDLASEVFGGDAGTVLVVGVGSEEHGDDGFGPLVVRLLKQIGGSGPVGNGLEVLDAGPAPELETWRIRELAPGVVLFVDAVDFGGAPGDVALLKAEDLRATGFDTHRAPLRLTMQYIESELGARCRLLAVQPKNVRLGLQMCAEVRGAAEKLAWLIVQTFSKHTGRRTPDGSEL